MLSTNYGRTLFLAAVLAVGAVCVSGCSDKKNPVSPSGGSIVCQDGEAWIKKGTDGGYIFTKDGEVIAVAEISEGRWSKPEKVGTYTTSGDKLTLVLSQGGTSTMTYEVSGGTLKLSSDGKTEEFVKKNGVPVDV